MIDARIQKKINELPLNVKHAIESFNWRGEIFNIANKYHLQIDQADAFQDETLLIMVGLENAESYGNHIAQKLKISEELAETLVAEANTLIFRPLQKIAFSSHDDEEEYFDENDKLIEEEIVDHEKISSLLEDHGIKLVDDADLPIRPKNDLQKMADQLFEKKTDETIEQETIETEQKKPEEPISYSEPIEEKDLAGIKPHTIDMSVLDNKRIQNNEKSLSNTLEKDLLSKPRFSKVELFDFSPSKEDQIIENGEYLEHIGEKTE